MNFSTYFLSDGPAMDIMDWDSYFVFYPHWPILSACMSEDVSDPDGKSLLQLWEGCLAFSSRSRFKAEQAATVQHAFFRESG